MAGNARQKAYQINRSTHKKGRMKQLDYSGIREGTLGRAKHKLSRFVAKQI